MQKNTHSLISFRSQRGVTYLLLMFAIVVMSISVTVAAKQWKMVVQREKEADLLDRGIAIQTALAAYSAAMKQGRVLPGEVYPLTLEELTKSPKPFLRKMYLDPMTGEEWEYVRDPTGRLKGVKSKSKLEPVKQHGFPASVRHFEGLAHYDEWVFQHPSASTMATQVPATGVPVAPAASPGAAVPLPGQPTAPFPAPPIAPPVTTP